MTWLYQIVLCSCGEIVIISSEDCSTYITDIAVVNSRALQELNINENSVAPSGGEFEKKDGKLTGNRAYPYKEVIFLGILKENALRLFQVKETDQEKKDHFLVGLHKCLEFGLTSVHTNDRDAFRFYKQLQDEGKMPIRVFLTVYADELDDPQTPQAGTKEGLITCNRYEPFSKATIMVE